LRQGVKAGRSFAAAHGSRTLRSRNAIEATTAERHLRDARHVFARRRATPAGTAKADHRRDHARCQASRADEVADALPPLGASSLRPPEERRGEAVDNAHRARRPKTRH